MKISLEGVNLSWDGWYETAHIWYKNTGGDGRIMTSAALIKLLRELGWTFNDRKEKRIRVNSELSVRSYQVRPPEGYNISQPIVAERTITLSKLTREYIVECLSNHELYSRWAFSIGKEPLNRAAFLEETSRVIKSDVVKKTTKKS